MMALQRGNGKNILKSRRASVEIFDVLDALGLYLKSEGYIRI